MVAAETSRKPRPMVENSAPSLAGNMTAPPAGGDETNTTQQYVYDAWNRLVAAWADSDDNEIWVHNLCPLLRCKKARLKNPNWGNNGRPDEEEIWTTDLDDTIEDTKTLLKKVWEIPSVQCHCRKNGQ